MNHHYFIELLEGVAAFNQKALTAASKQLNQRIATENDYVLAGAIANLTSAVSKLTEALIEAQKH